MNLFELKDFAEKILLEIDKEIEYHSDELAKEIEEHDFWEQYGEEESYRAKVEELEDLLFSLRLQRQKKQTELDNINRRIQNH